MSLLSRNLALTGIISLVGLAAAMAHPAPQAGPGAMAEAFGERAPTIAAEAPPAEFRDDPLTNPAAWDNVPEVILGAIDVASLLAEDARDQLAGGIPLRVGVVRQVEGGPVSAQVDGVWIDRPDGSVLWRMRLSAFAAGGVGLNFSRFDLPEGGRLVIGGTHDNEEPLAYDGLGPMYKGFFSAPPISGEAVFIEYQGPARTRHAVQVEIAEVSHLYRELWTGEPAGEGGVSLLPCQVDVMCRTVDTNARDAVGRMVFQSGQGTYVCSGALLADQDQNTFAAYFLTANHCISTQTEANTLSVRWRYQTNACNGSPNFFGTTAGATLLAHSSNTDFSFMRLSNDVNLGQGMAGWTTASVSGTVRGIHHPGGSYKRYSSGATTTQQPICGGLPLSRYVYNDWDDGVTEGGSSGSPLFNSSWQVVGQLFGVCYYNEPGCNNPNDYNNVYGRFSVTYPSVSSWLTAIIPDDQYEDNDDFASAKPIPLGTYALRLVDFEDYFRITLASPAVVSFDVTYAEANMDLALRVYDNFFAQLAVSNQANGIEHIQLSLPAGDYYVRLNRTLRWGGDYTLKIASATPPCPADLNNDGSIGQADLGILLANFGCLSGCVADIDGDGDVDQGDLGLLLAAFGTSCP